MPCRGSCITIAVEEMAASEWESLYRRFTRLSREWAVHEHPGVDRQLFHAAVLTRRSDADVAREFASFEVPLPPLWDEAREVSRLLDFDPRGRVADDPCDDVYQAALTMLPHGTWTPSPDHDQLYRGQRDARWAVIPSVFRLDDQARSERIARVSVLAGLVVDERPALTVEQALALIQHYSAELDAPTWLLDLTWDPAVALLFASSGGAAGDVGAVTMLVRQEWERFSASGRNRLGQIRVIEVPDVLRIERQRALFLDTSHPDLVEQYVAHSVWFRQVDGLVFEDPDADWPVTRESCFPDPDPTLELVRRLAVRAGPRLAPPSDASRRLDPDDYLAIALSWCEEDGVELAPPYLDVLGSVCHIHAALQAERSTVAIDLRSLHRLREAVDTITDYAADTRPLDVATALGRTLSRSMTNDEHRLLERLVVESAPSPSVLDTVSVLLDELPRTVLKLVAIGARDASDERVSRDIEAALADSRFRVFDLRGATDRTGIGALATDVGTAVRLLFIDGETASAWLERLVRAVLDDRDRIEFAEGWVDRPPGSSFVIVHYGAAGMADLLPPLAQAPIMEFI